MSELRPGRAPRIDRAAQAAAYAAAARLFREYQTAIGVDLCFQGFEAELADLPARYGGADSALWLAWHGALPVGCAALRPESGPPADRAGELKRLYVRPDWQGTGLGRRLLDTVIAGARARGYARLRLDTLHRFAAANRLYEAAGFREIPQFNANRLPGTRFMELSLAPLSARLG
jgi:GNAT superfamily N-acetyltransferase